LDQMKTDLLAASNDNKALIQALNNVSAQDIWTYSNRSSNLTDPKQVWNVAKTDLNTNNSIGKHIVDNLDANVSSRSTLTAADVWSSATRSLTDYSQSTLATAVWQNATRTLTSYGNNITAADVWNVLSSTLNTTGSIGKQLATNIDATTSSRATQTSVNDIQSDVTYIRSKADSIYTDTQAIKADTNSILDKWGTASAQDITNDLTTVKNRIGTSADNSSAETLYGRAKFLQEKWGTQTAQAIFDKADSTLSKITDVQSELGYNGKSTTAFDETQAIKNYVDSLETSIGSSSDGPLVATLFGKVQKVQDKVDTLDSIQTTVDNIQGNIGTDNNKEVIAQLSDISNKIKDVTTDVSGLEDMSNVNSDNLKLTKDIQNKVADFNALIDINKLLLQNKPIIKTYYEWGSVILKMVISNPLQIKQTVDFKAVLPREVKPEFIMTKSDDLHLEYDTEKELWYVTAGIELEGGQSIIKTVEVKDVWMIPSEEIDSLKNQINDLMKPLDGTAYFAQGTTLKNDGLSRLNKISWRQGEESATPAEHIITYRENANDLNITKQDVENLNKLVTDISSKNFLQGSVFGVSTTMTWAIILMMVIGVAILMTLFFILIRRSREPIIIGQAQAMSMEKTLPVKRISAKVSKASNVRSKKETYSRAKIYPLQENRSLMLKYIIAAIVCVLLIVLIVFLAMKQFSANKKAENVSLSNPNSVEIDIKDLSSVSMRTRN
ncbi:MAG: hypothetical protein PHW24_03205, partial [Candidatus Moranbacteria bacterium]|nr:hypothetical protein [Candidatus Moranbacteria bacterium]